MPDIYPTPQQAVGGSSGQFGPQYLKYQKLRKDWAAITLISKYEDSGVDTNESAADVEQEYFFFYDGLSDEDAQILDTFWDAHRLSISFTLVEPRDKPWTYEEGNTITGCKFISYEGDHGKVKTTQTRTVRIGKYPS